MVPEGRGQRGRRRSGPGPEGAEDGGGGRALKQMGDALTCPVWCAPPPPPPPPPHTPRPLSAESPEEESLEAGSELTHGWAAAARSLEVMSLPTAYLSCMHYFCRCALPPPGPPSRLPAASPEACPACVGPIILTGRCSLPPFNLSPPPTRRPQCVSRPVPAVSEQMSDVQCAGQAPRHAQLRAGRCHPWSLCRTQERGLCAGHAVSCCGDAR